MYGYIYLTTNLVNGKKYIGLHKSNKFDENYKGSGAILNKAIEKYGWDNFSCKIIEWCKTKDELAEREKYWISKYSASTDDSFYNIQSGGYGGWDFKDWSGENNGMYGVHRFGKDNPNYGKRHTFSEEQRKRMSDAHVGKPLSEEHKLKIGLGNKGKVLSDETKKKISEKAKLRVGWHHTEATKLKMSKNNAMNKEEYRIKVSKALKGRPSKAKNKIWIHNGDITKMIYPDEFATYEQKGYTKGRR